MTLYIIVQQMNNTKPHSNTFRPQGFLLFHKQTQEI
jgi:hypothetical protein